MKLQTIRVDNVRKIVSADLSLHPNINIFIGPNGSGKTSLLEAVFLLSGGRSFRTTRAREIIRHGEERLTVFGQVNGAEPPSLLGIEKSAKTTRLRLNNENVKTASQTVRLLPILVVNAESFKLLEGGPSNRRDLLDRVLFHVEPSYFDALRRFYQILKQRNASIRKELSSKEISLWDQPLVAVTEEINDFRLRGVTELNKALEETGIGMEVGDLELHYEPGWDKDSSFAVALENALDRDRLMKTTTVGPHRAEIKVLVEGRPAKTSFSRGQTKLAVVAIISAIEALIFDVTGKAPVLLIDDLASELDSRAKIKAIQLLTRTKTQAFFTAIEYNSLDQLMDLPKQVFHVEQGKIVAE